MTAARTLAFALCATLAAPSGASLAAPPVAQLAKDRVAAAEKAFRTASALHGVGRVPAEAVHAWSLHWLDAALDAAPRAARQALADHLTRMTDFEATVQKMQATGTASGLDADAAAFYRIEAELWAARGKR